MKVPELCRKSWRWQDGGIDPEEPFSVRVLIVGHVR